MQNFADQCLDLARSILSQNISAIRDNGTIEPVEFEGARADEPGHAALAIGEFYRATEEPTLDDFDLVDQVARCITAQAFTEEEQENGLAYAALGLLSFSPAKDRNIVWERLVDVTRERLDKRLLQRTDYDNHFQAFNIAKAVARYSLGLSKKDETGKLIDRFIERIRQRSSTGYHDDSTADMKFTGVFDVYGILSFVFIRQALQLHANIHLRDRKLPSLRTYAEKHLKMLPDLVRQDGLGFAYGRGIGAYGQMHCISILLQSMRDGWISDEQRPQYLDILRRLFQFFFVTYVDQEHGTIVVRDAERNTTEQHTTRMANFDAARYLCQWSRLARSIGGRMDDAQASVRRTGRFVIFDKTNRKEQGVFLYGDANSGLHIQLPLVASGGLKSTDYYAFPHSPGVFDWPVNSNLPIMVPELTFNGTPTVPCFYGRRCVTGLGLRKSLFFRYEQPELISTEEKMMPGIGSCKVTWNFTGNKVSSEFLYQVKQQVQLDHMRYQFVVSTPHSTYRLGTTFALGDEGLRPNITRDDFQGSWEDTDVVTNESGFRTYWGNVHYVFTYSRDHSLIMRPGHQYRISIEFEPDIILADE